MNKLHGLFGGLILLLAAPGLLALTGCGAVGDRARDGCPPGEICAPDTPNGLRFFGAPLGGTLTNAPSPVAIGGHQAIRFEDAASSAATLPVHHVVSSDSTRLSAESTAPRSASLRGITAGTADVRVLDASDRLLDRISVRSAQIARVDVVAGADLILALADSSAPVVFAEGTTRVAVALLDERGTRLVDDEMRITSPAAINTPEWDGVEGAFGAADVPLSVDAGGATFETVVRRAGVIDDFELATWLLARSPADEPWVGAATAVCVVPRSGGARVVGSTQRPIFLVDGAEISAMEPSTCIALPDELGTTVTIEVSLGAAHRTFTLPVDPDAASAMPLVTTTFTMPRIVPAALGARARGAWGLD